MLRPARNGAVAGTLLALASLPGCGASPTTAAGSAPARSALAPLDLSAPKPVRLFTLDTPVDRIAADPEGKAILDRDIPGVMASKEYPLFDDMSLTQIASLSGGRLSKNQLDLVQTDLVQLSSLSP